MVFNRAQPKVWDIPILEVGESAPALPTCDHTVVLLHIEEGDEKLFGGSVCKLEKVINLGGLKNNKTCQIRLCALFF